jgi:hypothetical protein
VTASCLLSSCRSPAGLILRKKHTFPNFLTCTSVNAERVSYERLVQHTQVGNCAVPNRSSKRKRRSKALPALGFGVSLSMASGACASTSEASANTPPPSQNHEIFLGEEEISDVSLATFYVFDKENAGPSPLSQKLRLAAGCGAGCGCSCGCACAGLFQPQQSPHATQPRQHLKKKSRRPS